MNTVIRSRKDSRNHDNEVRPASVVRRSMLLLVFALGVLTFTHAARADKQPIDVYLLVGQSNMSGLGYNTELPTRQADPLAIISLLDVSGNNVLGNAAWYPVQGGFGFTAAQHGIEVSFARRMRELEPHRPLAIIKVAYANTTLAYKPDVIDWHPTSHELADTAVWAMYYRWPELSTWWTPTLRGVFWLQGESDSTTNDYAIPYGANFATLADYWRVLLAPFRGSYYCPIYTARITNTPWNTYAGQRAVDMVNHALAADTIWCLDNVDVNTLPKNAGDPMHYSSSALQTLGAKFAEFAYYHRGMK